MNNSNQNQNKENNNIIKEANKNEIKINNNNNKEPKPLQLKLNNKKDNIKLEDAIPQANFSKLDIQDPSLKEGYKLVFEKEIPMDIKLENKKGKKDISEFEGIMFKVLKIQSTSQSVPSHIRIELYSENDLFFHFTSILDEEIFKVMKEKQDLTITYKEFIPLLEELCDNCLKYPDSYIAILVMKKKGEASLDFIKEIDVKFIQLLKMEFVNSSDDFIIKQMLYRFTSLKSKFDYYKNCMEVAGDIILEKNPNIIPQMIDYDNNYTEVTETVEIDENEL